MPQGNHRCAAYVGFSAGSESFTAAHISETCTLRRGERGIGAEWSLHQHHRCLTAITIPRGDGTDVAGITVIVELMDDTRFDGGESGYLQQLRFREDASFKEEVLLV